MKLEIHSASPSEQLYTYTQSQQIRSQTGNIGCLRGDMGSDGKEFYTSWTSYRDDLRSPEFIEELDRVINGLRDGKNKISFLQNRYALARYWRSHPEAKMQDPRSFGFRVDTEKYSYLMRLNPHRGEYNLYCYCYRRDWLERHLKEAEKGIRFISSDYQEKFRLPDGGKIRIRYPDGERRETVCRYIDDYHFEIGAGGRNLFHICEFAEIMEKHGAVVEPMESFAREKERGE